MTTGSSMHAMIRTAPPQAGQVSMSIPKIRFECQLDARLRLLVLLG